MCTNERKRERGRDSPPSVQWRGRTDGETRALYLPALSYTHTCARGAISTFERGPDDYPGKAIHFPHPSPRAVRRKDFIREREAPGNEVLALPLLRCCVNALIDAGEKGGKEDVFIFIARWDVAAV